MKLAGATTSVNGKVYRIKAWVFHHRSVLSVTVVHMLEHKLSSIMNWLVIGIALALPSLLYLILSNISAFSGEWEGKPRASLFLQSEVTENIGIRIADEISTNQLVETVRFISSESALKDFQEISGLSNVMNSLERNPLPHVIEVVLKTMDPNATKELVLAWKNSESIARVSFEMAWLERLSALLTFGERLVVALGVVLGLGVILTMGNTVRLIIENRRQEIEVIKLVGGTDSFVRRPFLYLGFCYGFGGAIFAIALLQFGLVFLAGPLEGLAQSYFHGFALEGLGLRGNMALIALGSVLGMMGALLAVYKHLKAIEP